MLIAPCLILLLQDPAPKEIPPPPPEPKTAWELLLQNYDLDSDGIISRQEYSHSDEHWSRLDQNEDGKLEESEIAALAQKGMRGGRRGGRGKRDASSGQKGNTLVAPKEGALAPDFKLQILGELDPKTKTLKSAQLSKYIGEKPVALIFGSYT